MGAHTSLKSHYHSLLFIVHNRNQIECNKNLTERIQMKCDGENESKLNESIFEFELTKNKMVGKRLDIEPLHTYRT